MRDHFCLHTSYVKNSRKYNNYIYRFRVCKICGDKFKTTETVGNGVEIQLDALKTVTVEAFVKYNKILEIVNSDIR